MLDGQYVLCFGQDDRLLETRRMLLEQSGYRTCSTTDGAEAERCLLHGEIALLVLCHSLENAQVERMLAVKEEAHSAAAVLCLSTGESVPMLTWVQMQDARQGPAALLQAVGALVRAQRGGAPTAMPAVTPQPSWQPDGVPGLH